MKKIQLQFMVVPDQLLSRAYVPNPVRVKILEPYSTALTDLLGESGRRLARAGAEFYFTRHIAEKLIFLGVAKEIIPKVSMAKVNKSAREIWGRQIKLKQSHKIAAAVGAPLHEDRLEKL